jgi:serine/threonine-protein kinase
MATTGMTSAQDSLLLATIVPTSPSPTMRSASPAIEAAPAAANVPAATRRAEPAATPSPPATATPAKESTRERRAREARERDAARLAAAVPAVVATGKVRIAVSPWGQVEVDGVPSGAAPPLTELTLAEGRHQIVVRNGEFTPFVASVDVVAGQPISLRHKFGS